MGWKLREKDNRFVYKKAWYEYIVCIVPLDYSINIELFNLFNFLYWTDSKSFQYMGIVWKN